MPARAGSSRRTRFRPPRRRLASSSASPRTALETFSSPMASMRIFKIDRRGSLSIFAGNGVHGFAGDGDAAVDVSLLNPFDVVLDARGSLYFSNPGNCRVRKVDPG